MERLEIARWAVEGVNESSEYLAYMGVQKGSFLSQDFLSAYIHMGKEEGKEWAKEFASLLSNGGENEKDV